MSQMMPSKQSKSEPSLSKRVKTLRSETKFSLENTVLKTKDLLLLVISYLKVKEIIGTARASKEIFIYLNENKKSLPTIKKCLSYDFGEILSHPQFKFDYKSSLQLINEIY